MGEEEATKVTWELGLGHHGIREIWKIKNDGGGVKEGGSACVDGGGEGCGG